MNNLMHGNHKNRRPGYFGLLAALLLAGPVVAQEGDGQTSVPRPAKVIEVQAVDAALTRQYPAIVYPSREAELSFRVSGRVVALPARAATQLQQGDVIAELDKRDFENTIARLESQRDQSAAQLAALKKGARAEEIVALQAAVYASQAKVDQARQQVNRTRELFEKEIVAKAQLEKDEAILSVAQAELRTTEEELVIGQSGGRAEDVEAAEAALRGLETDIANARNDLADATLRAPFDGVVARRHIDNFTNIRAGENIVLLHNLSTIDLVFDVPGADVLMWTSMDWENLEIAVELTGSDRVLIADELVEFSTQADAGTQTYQARISVDVPSGRTALGGMVGRVSVTAPSRENVTQINVPITALATSEDGNPFVWIVDPASNAVSARKVETGEMSVDQVNITSGLEPGETVVTAGVSRLSEGLVIRPITTVGN
jgi:membrane fusion protein, multidrug efflux system